MKIGEKIRILREIKGITAKDMASELDMTQAGYLKIERDEVDINTDKIEKISNRLGMKPYELLMEEKITLHFSNNSNNDHGNFGVFNTIHFPEELKNLYEDKIKLLEDKIELLSSENTRLKKEAESRKG